MDFYDLDDSFLDDEEIDSGLQALAICEAKYEDFMIFKGVVLSFRVPNN